MGTRRVTPAPIITRLCEIRGAKVGGGDENRGASGMAPPLILGAFDFKTSTTTIPIVKQRRTQRRRVDSIALAVKISIPTSTTCEKKHKHNKVKNL